MEKLPQNAYGKQLMFDGYAANPALCADVTHLYEFLMRLPNQIGMRRVGFPHIIQITEKGIKGLSGFVFIMESHISVHTYEERGFITMDVYSCKTFDVEATVEHLTTAFDVKTYETKTAVRGLQFHHSPIHTTPTIATGQR